MNAVGKKIANLSNLGKNIFWRVFTHIFIDGLMNIILTKTASHNSNRGNSHNLGTLNIQVKEPLSNPNR